MNNTLTKWLILGFTVAVSSAAHAQVSCCPYRAAILNNIPQNDAAGHINEIRTSNKSDGSELAFYANFSATNGQIANGYWLVLSEGPNPKGYPGQLAIFYMDASGSTPKLTAYGYNGQNADTSFHDGDNKGGAPDKLASANDLSWLKSITSHTNADGTKTIGFTADTTKINKAHGGIWTGSQFGDKLGIWFHPVTGLQTSYDRDGYLKSWNYSNVGWFDSNDLPTQCSNNPVPEPASFLTLGLGVVAASLRRRKA